MTEAQIQELETALSDEDRAMLDGLVDEIARLKMVSAALFFFESMSPMGFVLSQVLLFFRPIAAVLWTEPRKWDAVQKVLERRGSIELLLRRLEARA